MIDPANLAAGFQPIADLPIEGAYRAAFTMNGKGYVLSGLRMYEYNPAPSNSWTNKGPAPNISGNYNATVLNGRAFAWNNNGKMYEYIANY